MKDDVVSVSGKTFETYSWQDDQMDIVRHVIWEFDNQRTHEIADHFKCDLSEIREWLERKNKPQTNADRIRAMTDTELEEWLTAFVCSNIAPHATARGAAKKGRLLEWLKKESEGE